MCLCYVSHVRKLLIPLASLVLTLCSYASAGINFANMDWLISSSEARRVMDSKGYKFLGSEKESGATDYVFRGIIGTSNAKITLAFTPEDELVYVIITTDELTNPAQVYNSLSKALTEKYGEPSDSEDKRSPQFQNIWSDTQLSQGIRLGEVYWLNAWDYGDEAVEMETLKGGKVRLDYFSPYWNDEYDRRNAGDTSDL